MRLAFGGVALFALVMAGCGSRTGDAKVSGTVKFTQKPLASGYVLLRFDSGNEVKGDIAPDGTYIIHTKEQGHAKIAVGSPKPETPKGDDRRNTADANAPDPSKWIAIPAKYLDPETSGKDATVNGATTLNIELD